ncbi:MAG TPA: YihY/virulence factor BrkB family protein [Gemmatimonadales bacterium]
MRRTALDRASFVWHDVRDFVVRVYEGAAEANVPFLASGLSFDALLAAIPFILLLLAVAGYVLSAKAGHAQLEIDDYLRRYVLPLPDDQASPFAPVLALAGRVVSARGTLGLLGLPLFVWFSTRLFGSLRASLNEVFDTRETRSWLQGKVNDILLVGIATSLFVINAALTQGVTLLAQLNLFGLGFLAYFGAQLLAFASIVTVFVVIFRYAPAHHMRRDTALFAALICALGFEAAKQLTGIYIRNMFHPSAIVSDGTIAGMLLFVIWTYYMAFVFLIGGQIAQVYDLRRRQGQQKLLLG